MTELLDRRPDLDAVFVASDLMAAGAPAAVILPTTLVRREST
jgi:DNA-binding LacI/PurR family transcriptional regulator